MAAILLLGFGSGLPLYLTSKTLQAWMTLEKVDLKTIGAFGLVSFPYTFKFLWSPLIDRYAPSFLGRRRGWLLVTQVGLLLAIAAMALQDPQRSLRFLALAAVAVAFFSATQDIAFDAYKIDVLDERERGPGASLGVLGYRIALLATGSAAFILADRMPWTRVYLIMAVLMLVGIGATFWAPEPRRPARPPASLADAIRLPFLEFFQRSGAGLAVVILVFIVLYKLGDAMLNLMATPFLLKAGFTQTDIGAVQGGLGLAATIVGVLAGGAGLARLGLNRSLWIFGVLQSGVNVTYYFLSTHPGSYPLMVTAVIAENFFQGMGTAALVAFMMSLSSPRFSATQYALLSSFYAFGRDQLAAPSGALAEATGWPTFFLISVAAAIPGLLLLPFFAPWNADEPRGAVRATPTDVDAAVVGRGETEDRGSTQRP
ncbi:MAG: AmpG family muropeptide MFS transporter [Gemmatimonadetes bacterium]|nr:AmpG family muropeptide MFS transporter [Gemmatimonadota bacterium]